MTTTNEIIQKMAEKIVDIEFSGRHTWNSCMETARTRATYQAKELYNLLTDIAHDEYRCVICSSTWRDD